MTRYLSPIVILVGILGGCKNDVMDASDISDRAAQGELIVSLGGDSDPTGGEGEVNTSVEEVWVRFEDVQVQHENKGWISISDDRADFDLMTLRDGDTAVIGQADTYEGAYDSLRLVVADSWIVVDGAELDLAITEGIDVPEEGINLDKSFFVDQNVSSGLFVGWDLDTQLTNDGDAWSLGTDAVVEVALDGS